MKDWTHLIEWCLLPSSKSSTLLLLLLPLIGKPISKLGVPRFTLPTPVSTQDVAMYQKSPLLHLAVHGQLLSLCGSPSGSPLVCLTIPSLSISMHLPPFLPTLCLPAISICSSETYSPKPQLVDSVSSTSDRHVSFSLALP